MLEYVEQFRYNTEIGFLCDLAPPTAESQAHNNLSDII